jgi:hypothetical protein
MMRIAALNEIGPGNVPRRQHAHETPDTVFHSRLRILRPLGNDSSAHL